MKKYKLINNKSSIIKLNFSIKGINIYYKDENTLDFCFGGNKVRLFEYIAQVIINSKAEKVITFGSCYSNYIRVTSAVCNKLNKKCILIVIGDDRIISPNIEIAKKYGAEIVYCKKNNAHDFIDEYLKKENNYIWIPGGGHIKEAVYGYVDASKEIEEQRLKLKLNEFDAIFVPCGTGTTQAGLIYGFSNRKTEIIGTSIARKKKRCIDEISLLLEELNVNFDRKKIIVKEIQNNKYGGSNERIINSNRALLESDQIVLDPIYNSKAFYGMCEYLKKTKKKYKNVLFINTGGNPNVFRSGENDEI